MLRQKRRSVEILISSQWKTKRKREKQIIHERMKMAKSNANTNLRDSKQKCSTKFIFIMIIVLFIWISRKIYGEWAREQQKRRKHTRIQFPMLLQFLDAFFTRSPLGNTESRLEFKTSCALSESHRQRIGERKTSLFPEWTLKMTLIDFFAFRLVSSTAIGAGKKSKRKRKQNSKQSSDSFYGNESDKRKNWKNNKINDFWINYEWLRAYQNYLFIPPPNAKSLPINGKWLNSIKKGCANSLIFYCIDSSKVLLSLGDRLFIALTILCHCRWINSAHN